MFQFKPFFSFVLPARSWFFESAKAFSPLIVVELIFVVLCAACVIFQLDLVIIFIILIKWIDLTFIVLFALMIMLNFRPSSILISRSFCCLRHSWLFFRICFCIATLVNWQQTAIGEWRTVYSNQIGMRSPSNCKSMCFSWLQTLRNRFSIKDSMLLFWIWKHFVG